MVDGKSLDGVAASLVNDFLKILEDPKNESPPRRIICITPSENDDAEQLAVGMRNYIERIKENLMVLIYDPPYREIKDSGFYVVNSGFAFSTSRRRF